MGVNCEKCNNYGIVIVKKIISGYQYDYAFTCDCWEGISRNERYPSVKDMDKVKYSSVD
jgi:hypothetical protein